MKVSTVSRIFISYRRSDSQDAVGRIYDQLADAFSPTNVFRDLDSIPISVEFPAFIEQALQRSAAVIVVIGPGWISARDLNGNRRLEDPTDSVRLEIETALRLGRAIVPVTVTNAQLPTEDTLPGSLRGLVRCNGLPIRPDPDFHNDIEKLIRALRKLGLESNGHDSWRETPSTKNPSTFLADGETFTSTHARFQFANGSLHLPDGARLFLRLIPSTGLSTIRSSLAAKELVQSGGLRPMVADGHPAVDSPKRNRYGAFVCDPDDSKILAMTQLFKNGELWGIDARTVNAKFLSEHAPGKPLCFYPGYIEKVYCQTLYNYLQFSREALRLEFPLRLRAGATDVQGYCMERSNALAPFAGHVVDEHIVYDSLVQDPSAEVSEILRPFFEYLWEECGLTRPDVDVGRLQ